MKTRIQITSLGSSGEGIGSLNGLKVFVDGALPNEEVEVELTEVKKNYAKARLLKVLTPSKDRRSPPCPLFGACGGCQLMHLSDEGQLEAKRQRVVDSLERIGGFKNLSVSPCIPSPQTLHYRNKIQLPIIVDALGTTIGLYRKESHEIIPLDKCYIQDTRGDRILEAIRPLLTSSHLRYLLIRTAVNTDEALVILVTTGRESPLTFKRLAEQILEKAPLVKGVIENPNPRKDNVILGTRYHLLAGRSFFYESLLGKTFRISASSFFQINPPQTERLYAFAIEAAQIQNTHTVVDAFCGVGTLALFAADKARQVIGIECVPHAIEDAKENARLNKISNAEFYCGTAETLYQKLPSADHVFLNPPRKGCAPELLHFLGLQRPSSLIYISCDPATLARDLAILIPYGYQIDCVQPFDMFPQTMHVETCVRMRLGYIHKF